MPDWTCRWKAQVCIVDENGQKLVSEKVESTPEALAAMLGRYRPIERAVIETGRRTRRSGLVCVNWVSRWCALMPARRTRASRQ